MALFAPVHPVAQGQESGLRTHQGFGVGGQTIVRRDPQARGDRKGRFLDQIIVAGVFLKLDFGWGATCKVGGVWRAELNRRGRFGCWGKAVEEVSLGCRLIGRFLDGVFFSGGIGL
jgi:hypothetical protein